MQSNDSYPLGQPVLRLVKLDEIFSVMFILYSYESVWNRQWYVNQVILVCKSALFIMNIERSAAVNASQIIPEGEISLSEVYIW